MLGVWVDISVLKIVKVLLKKDTALYNLKKTAF